VQSILVEVHGERGLYYLSKLTTPSGRDLVESAGIVTRSARALPGLASWMYPNAPGIAVEAGDYELLIRAEDPQGGHIASEHIEVRVYLKEDTIEPTCGIHLDFIVDREAIHPDDFEHAVDELAAQVDALYAQVGVHVVDYALHQTELLSPDVEYGPSGASAVAAVARILAQARTRGAARDGSVHVIVVRSIGGFRDPLGYSMGLPGPYDGTLSNAAIFIGTSGYVGSDGYLDLQGLATTLAHETGHFLGLYHTSEHDEGFHDPIPDTPECDGVVCGDEYRANIMTSGTGAFRSVLTPGQGEVVRGHPLCRPYPTQVTADGPPECRLTCSAPDTCSIWQGMARCLPACDPDESRVCDDGSLCVPDDTGTYVCGGSG
jgi:hypothetical protein